METAMPTKRNLAPILWPLGVIGTLCVSLSVCTITVIAATSDESFAVEDDYYAKAVAWDDTAAQRVRNEELGWTTETVVTVRGDVRIKLHDATGEPMTGARLRIFAFHHAARGDATETAMTETTDPGVYAASCGTPRAGVWQVRIRAESGGAVFTHTVDTLTGSITE